MDIDINEYLDDLLTTDLDIEEETSSVESKSESVEQKDLSSNEASHILDVIDHFSSINDNIEYPSIYIKALYPISTLKGINTISLFQIDEEYDFFLRAVVPYEKEDIANTVFKKFTEIGRVGKTLQTGQYNRILKRDQASHLGALFPLVYNNSIWGILQAEFEEGIDTDNYVAALDTFSRILGPNLRLKELEEQQNSLKKNQEQIISSKTTELRNSRREINTIIDTVQAGIVLADKSTLKILSINPFAEAFAGYRSVDLDKEDISLKKMFPNYSISFGPLQDKIETKGGRSIDVIRNSNIVKLSDRDTIVETFLDISFIADIKKEYDVEKTLLISEYENKLVSQREDLQKGRRQEIENSLLLDKELDESSAKQLNVYLSNLNSSLRQPLANLRLIIDMLSDNQNKDKINANFDIQEIATDSINLMVALIENVFQNKDTGETQLISPEHLFNQIIQKEAKYLNIDIELNNLPNQSLIFNHFVFIKSITNLLRYLDSKGVERTTASSKLYDTYIKIDLSIDKELENDGISTQESYNIDYQKDNQYIILVKDTVKNGGGKFELIYPINGGTVFTILLPFEEPKVQNKTQ